MTSHEISHRLGAVQARVARAAERAGRDPASVEIVGVSKRKPADLVVAAVRAGLRHIGESYAQEAVAKLPGVLEALSEAGLPAPHRHFVGRLQSNKARQAVELFDVVESVDRPALARELSRRAEALGRELEVLIQVDLAGEASKGGVPASEAPGLLELCATLPALSVVGLMTLPPATADPEAARPCFARLRGLREALRERAAGARLRELSMGMSADFEVAVEEGATWVRVGTALFGPRED